MADRCAADDLPVAVLDTGIRRQLATTSLIQLGQRPMIVAQQPANRACHLIARFPRVDHQGPPTRPAQHQRDAQPGRATTDDDAFPLVIQAASVAEVAIGQTRS